MSIFRRFGRSSWLLAACLVVAGGLLLWQTPQARAACPTASADNGSASYQNINVSTAATYRVWTRMQTTVAQNNSFMLEVDGNTCYSVGGSTLPTNTWTWVDYSGGNTSSVINVPLTQGIHSFKVVGSSSGVRIDRYELLNDTTCTPTGTGDNCLPYGVTLPFHMAAGSTGFTDPANVAWISDTAYASGASTPWTAAPGTTEVPEDPTHAISGTTNPQLYLSGRWGMAGYKIPVENGSYNLILHFAEIGPTKGTPRVFNVTAQSQPILTNFNIEKEVGDYTADDKTFPVTVSDGFLQVGFSTTTDSSGNLVGAPKLSGLEIVPTSTATSTPTPTSAPTLAPTSTPTPTPTSVPTPTPTKTPTPTPTATSSCPVTGDVNCDNHVTSLDLALLLSNWNKQSGATRSQGDLSGDGKVTSLDLAILLSSWGK